MIAAGIPTTRRFDLDYEALCADPRGIIDNLHDFFALNGCNLNRRYEVPSRFERRDEVRIDKSLYDAMVGYAKTT